VLHPVTVDPQPDGGRVRAEPDQAAVRARPRREALGAEVDRLEQVGLARSVLARDEDDSRSEGEIERRVRAEVPERDGVDDQPARRIGMIR
jgi:hypothetical protein